MVSGEMGAGAWHEGREAGDEVDGVEHDMSGAVMEGVLHLGSFPTVCCSGSQAPRHGRAVARRPGGRDSRVDRTGGAATARWLKLSPHERENTGLMAPSHALRREINGHIRERLARDRVIRGPAFEGERLVGHGYTNAEKAVAANYAPGDVVAFHCDYRSLGVAKGDERRVAVVDGARGTVMLEGRDGKSIPRRLRRVGTKRGGVEVYRTETLELRVSDRIRWTRNDTGLGLVNSDTAEVAAVRGTASPSGSATAGCWNLALGVEHRLLRCDALYLSNSGRSLDAISWTVPISLNICAWKYTMLAFSPNECVAIG